MNIFARKKPISTAHHPNKNAVAMAAAESGLFFANSNVAVADIPTNAPIFSRILHCTS